MHGQAYLTSAEHAAHLGPFDGFALNREPMLRVIEMHRDSVEAIDRTGPPSCWTRRVPSGIECLDMGRRHGYRNSQVTVLAADRDHRVHDGLRHDRGRARHRAGQVQATGRRRDAQDRQPTVPMALRKLGYDEPVIRGILDTIDAQDTIEGAPGLRDEHLRSSTARSPQPQGGRSIHFRGHLRMMSAVQPFLSGAISKTCNVPSDATVADIREAYLEGWRLGLKGTRDLPRRLEGEPAGEHEVGNRRGIEWGGESPPDRDRAPPRSSPRRRPRHPARRPSTGPAPIRRRPLRPVSSRGARGCPTPVAV